MSHIRVLQGAFVALAFATAVPAGIAVVQVPVAAAEPVETEDGNRCRDCTVHDVCNGDVCSTVTVCGAWYNC